MIRIISLNCVFASRAGTWRIDLLRADGVTTSFTVSDAESVETFMELFEDCTECRYDEASGEVRFAFESLDDDEYDEDDEEDLDEDDDIEDEDDDEPIIAPPKSSRTARKKS